MVRAPEASFLGAHTNKIDGKGRVAAPADFRKALDLKVFNGFFCVPSLEGTWLDCGGPDFIGSLKAMISALPPFDARRSALQIHLLGKAKPVSLDGDGRFILHDDLRFHANLGDKAFFLGVGDTFQIHPVEKIEMEIAASQDIAKAALKDLNNPISPHMAGGSDE